jgi:hypothetical protein
MTTPADEAAEIVSGERRDIYGPPEKAFQTIATLWGALFGQDVSVKQVCLALALLKFARIINNHEHRDSRVDLHGYLQIYDGLCGEGDYLRRGSPGDVDRYWCQDCLTPTSAIYESDKRRCQECHEKRHHFTRHDDGAMST